MRRRSRRTPAAALQALSGLEARLGAALGALAAGAGVALVLRRRRRRRAQPWASMPEPSAGRASMPEPSAGRASMPEPSAGRPSTPGVSQPEDALAEDALDPAAARILAEEAAAAAEAGAIGGPQQPDAPADPAMEAVYEAGGGEAEGFEASERDLIANASHDDGHGDPLLDALTPEIESDRSPAAYGAADGEESTAATAEDPGDSPR